MAASMCQCVREFPIRPGRDQAARDIVAMLLRRERRLRQIYQMSTKAEDGRRELLELISLANWTQAHNTAMLARRRLGEEKTGAKEPPK